VEITVLAYQQDAHKKYLWHKDKLLKRYTTADLEILVATKDRQDLSFLEKMFDARLSSIESKIIVVNQGSVIKSLPELPDIKVVNDVNYGLSRSRNTAIAHSTAQILWILDDDCVVVDNAVDQIVNAHNTYDNSVLTFQTITPSGDLIRKYPASSQLHCKNSVKKILSPEITIKKSMLFQDSKPFNDRFGLGSQFQDGENYIFFLDTLKNELEPRFVPETIAMHEQLTSSDEVASNRLIYARGAIAAHRNYYTAGYYQLKYMFFLWRKGYVRNFNELIDKGRIYGHGIEDYFWGFESHRNHHLDL
jgi:glycosyltransferase involved in cell wall biosynthesis